MSLLARFKFFIIGIFLGSILVFFFFGDKVKKWFFLYSSSGRVVNHLIEPRYTIIHDQDTIAVSYTHLRAHETPENLL